jgi:MFS family permease
VHPTEAGRIVSAGLFGAAAGAVAATLGADRLGRRRFVFAVSALGALGSLAFAATTSPLLLAVAAFAGMLNGMGRDRGAASILDQAMLPATGTDAERTATLARYNVAQDAGHALGALAAGIPALLRARAGIAEVATDRGLLVAYGAVLLAIGVLYLRSSPRLERPATTAPARLSPAARRIVARISALFALDAVGGGFLTTTLLSYFFFERFGADEATVGALFFGARVLNALSHLGAAWLARRIGLVNTMVFTHIPSSLLLATVAWAPSFRVAAVLFLLREGLVEMDVPTRQSYVMAVVRPEERTAAAGVTSLVRLAGWAVAPALAGQGMERVSLAAPLVVGAALKVAYDVLLYLAFRGIRPPEERVA